MIVGSCRFLKVNVRAATALVSLLVASCAPQHSPPQQVRASNPSVTYKYNSDQELLQVNQSATTFCNQYRAVPRPASFANDPDGSKVVVFECVQMTAPMASPPQFDPNLTYNYRTDAELLDASQNAQMYCMNNGSRQVISNIVTNTNGTKTVTFQCSRP
jgi:methionyl-tRNA formyltransferase